MTSFDNLDDLLADFDFNDDPTPKPKQRSNYKFSKSNNSQYKARSNVLDLLDASSEEDNLPHSSVASGGKTPTLNRSLGDSIIDKSSRSRPTTAKSKNSYGDDFDIDEIVEVSEISPKRSESPILSPNSRSYTQNHRVMKLQ